LVGGATGYLGLAAINGTAPLFPVHGTPPFSFVDLVGAAALGLAAAIGARAFAWLLLRAKHISSDANRLLGVLGAGASIALLFAIGRALTGQSLVLTPGYAVVAWALDPKRSV